VGVKTAAKRARQRLFADLDQDGKRFQ